MRFGEIVRDPGFMDISLHGRRFTWSNARENPVLARLNIFLVSTEWNAKFTNTKQIALPNTFVRAVPDSIIPLLFSLVS